MSIKVDENDPIGELEPSFPYRDVTIHRNFDMKEFYDLEGEIGRGKFGTVYRCREKTTGLALAAKFVGIARREDRRNVEREVQIMRMLQHPRIIQLYDACEAANVMCVIQELIEGGELFDRVIGDDFILTEKSCTVFVRQICEGVAFIHSKNVLHLDLKPENILCLTKTGNRIKIIDFGLARQYDPSKKLQVLFGTPEFVAPEVVNFDSISFATDMWSVGVICYVLLSGLSPFMGETDVETMANVTIAQYDFDDEAFDDISDDAKDFIRKLLSKDASCRYTAAECLNHPWLRRRPLPVPSLDTAKDNLRDTVDRWAEREPTPPSQIAIIPQPLATPVPQTKEPQSKTTLQPKEPKSKAAPQTPGPQSQPASQPPGPQQPQPAPQPKAAPQAKEPQPQPDNLTQTTPTPEIASSPTVKPDSTSNDVKSSEMVSATQKITQEEKKKKSQKATDTTPKLDPTKQVKTELVDDKVIKDSGPEDVKVSTLSWTKKKPSINSQMSLPEGNPLPTSKKLDSKSNTENKFPSKFPLKPSSSMANTANTITSKIQQGGTEITISKKCLNPSPQPKISGIVLGQTHPRGSETTTKKPTPTEAKPKIITHKIIVEGQVETEKQKGPSSVSKPINIDNSNHPLLKTLQNDRFERRCSDITCLMQEIENSADGTSIMNEIKRLSSRLFESDLLDTSNNNTTSSLLRQIANRGVAPRRPKFRVTNLNRDVPIGSPPPPTNMTYFIPPNIFSPDSYTSQTHSAPQTPSGSPERSPEALDKNGFLKLINQLEEHTDKSTITNNYVVNESKKKKSTVSSK